MKSKGIWLGSENKNKKYSINDKFNTKKNKTLGSIYLPFLAIKIYIHFSDKRENFSHKKQSSQNKLKVNDCV